MPDIIKIDSIWDVYVLIGAAFFLGGIAVLVIWLAMTDFGSSALEHSPVRRHRMEIWVPFVPLGIWFVGTAMVVLGLRKALPQLSVAQQAFWGNVVFIIGGVVGIVVTVWLASKYFARRLRGYGLTGKNILKDFALALPYLAATYPIIALMMYLVVYIGKFIYGQEYEISQHQELELLSQQTGIAMRVLIFLVTVIVAPLFEEMVFRGMVQSMMRTYTRGPWRAIFITSAIFAAVHANATHWPALFALAVCLGYAYEKSGSLWRPIFIHAIFNATSVIAVMLQNGTH